MTFAALFFGYTKVEQIENAEREAYTLGIQAFEQHLDVFFKAIQRLKLNINHGKKIRVNNNLRYYTIFVALRK